MNSFIKRLKHVRFGNVASQMSSSFLGTEASSPPPRPPSTPHRVRQCSGGGCRRDPEELGQPTYWTHPHLFECSASATDFGKQVTPGITRQEFEQRRSNYVNCLLNYQNVYFSTQMNSQEKARFVDAPFSLLNSVTSKSFMQIIIKVFKIQSNKTSLIMKKAEPMNFIAIIPSAMITHMSPDVPNRFKQNSDFLYLTGFKEPNSVLVVSKTDANASPKFALFVREKNPRIEIWEGPCTGAQNISKLCGNDLVAYSIDEFKTYLESLIRECSSKKRVVLWRYPSDQVFKQESGPYCHIDNVETTLDEFTSTHAPKLIDMLECDHVSESNAASYFNSSRYFVQLLRTRKSRAEIDVMSRACQISTEAFVNAMRISHAYIDERRIEAKFEFDCRVRGAEHLAYIPVIAGGARATSLHYIRNNQIVKPDSLVLVDAGCQLNDYASDISRTWPVNGRFKGPQKDLYEICLRIQKYCIEQCRPGLCIQDLYYIMMRQMANELSAHGLLDRNEFESVAKPSRSRPNDTLPSFYLKKVVRFCPHDVGHYLGLDVHDCPEVSKLVRLEPGMVITIEPGIYTQPGDEQIPAQYRGIGIRIEDDVVITEYGCQVLNPNCPKEIEQIENLMK